MSEPSGGPLRTLWRSRLGAAIVAERTPPSGVEIVVDPDAEASDLADVTVLVDGRPDETALDAPSLRHVVVPYAGIHDELREAVRVRPHLTLQNSHFNASFVAQHAAALLLACAARLGRYDRALRAGDWRQPDGVESIDLAGRTAVLLGFGAIGRSLLPMLRGFGLQLEAVRRRPDPHEPDVPQHPVAALHDVLPRAQVLIVSLPATEATHGLMDADAYAALPDDAIVINVGRGEVLDEEATWRALETGRLAGLGLDVWWRYPEGSEARAATLPAHRPFHLHPDVVMSPHRANAVQRWQEASVRDVFRTLEELAAGAEPRRNRIDVEQGY